MTKYGCFVLFFVSFLGCGKVVEKRIDGKTQITIQAGAKSEQTVDLAARIQSLSQDLTASGALGNSGIQLYLHNVDNDGYGSIKIPYGPNPPPIDLILTNGNYRFLGLGMTSSDFSNTSMSCFVDEAGFNLDGSPIDVFVDLSHDCNNQEIFPFSDGFDHEFAGTNYFSSGTLMKMDFAICDDVSSISMGSNCTCSGSPCTSANSLKVSFPSINPPKPEFGGEISGDCVSGWSVGYPTSPGYRVPIGTDVIPIQVMVYTSSNCSPGTELMVYFFDHGFGGGIFPPDLAKTGVSGSSAYTYLKLE